MSRNTVVRQELLGRLGLEESATDQEVEEAHNGLVDFLELAPSEVKSWATAKTVDVDTAFALLSGPEEDLVQTSESPAATPVALAKVAPAAPFTPAAFAPVATDKSKRNMYAAGIVAVIIIVVFGVWYMGRDNSAVPGISGTPTSGATTAAAQPTAAPLDQAKVAALMQKISSNPKDKASLAELGGLYFASADYKNAALWEQKVLAVDPKNQEALLALGAAQFNQGNQPAAKKQWLIAAGLYPKNAEVHYDLGFYYMSQKPPDSANMKAEWAKVVAIDPNSALAKSVQTSITGTKSPGATATPTAK